MNKTQILKELHQRYGIDPSAVLFFENGEPWLRSELLIQIARQSERFQSIDDDFDQVIAGLNQIVHKAHLIDLEGKRFSFCGVATIGEKLPSGEVADPHELAASRALVRTLNAAGFNPFKPASVVPFPTAAVEDDPVQRLSDLSLIHIMAQELGLILGRDKGRYVEWLRHNYATDTAADLDAKQRASAISALKFLVAELAEAKK